MDAQEFTEIAEKHSGFVYNVAYRMMGNPHDAEEVAQDAFVSAYKARDRFRGDAQPTTWLYRITVNAALMRIRKDKRGKEMTVPEEARPDVASSNWAESPVAATMNSELASRIDEAINDLPANRAYALVAVAKALNASGDRAGALELLDDADKSASKIGDPAQQKDALKMVRQLQAKLKA